MAAHKVLAVAVSSGRAGYVCMQGADVQDWGVTVKATTTTGGLVGFFQQLVTELEPDVVVTEHCRKGCRKGRRTKQHIHALAEIASHNTVLDVSVPRPRRYATKYEEADAMAKRHPELAGYRPLRKRRFFDFEPRAMVLFEAVALAEAVIHRGANELD